MSPSAGLTEAAREIVRMVRPELDQQQVEVAANVIAADVRPDAATVDPEDVRRTHAAVEDAIARRQSAGTTAAL